jgi:hypothetical protein
MSQHYEVVFSMFLRDDVSVEALHELHWQLGLGATMPAIRVLAGDSPVLTPALRAKGRRGRVARSAEMATLQRQYRSTGAGAERESHGWGLHARLYWPEELWSRNWWLIANWLAEHAEDGYAGFYRAESVDEPNVLIIRDRKAYLRGRDSELSALSS